MEDEFQCILNSVKKKLGRSRLDVRRIDRRLRRRGLTYRYISDILTEQYQLHVSKSTVNDFVRVRSRQKRNAARQAAIEAMIVTPIIPKAALADSAQKPSEGEVRQRIASLKARKPVTTPSLDDFHFDPTQPLRLIARGKPGSD